ncbi:hypothetical protein EW026_g7529 [Hermanssonia centrifuga]|uniref:Uncharacterized protein n=1 Tax=Hermanssonia centrifuga TaxID=98765 RepID=A0A4S4K8L4_9APHY|nr:hypothetical protein EW026_g7529 [Hermanssonia centrifuga]
MKNKEDYQTWLENVRKEIWKRAHEARERFPSHTEKYFVEAIMAAPKKASKRREKNCW